MFLRDRHRLRRPRRCAVAVAVSLIAVFAAELSTSLAFAAGPVCTAQRFPSLAHGFNLTGWFDDEPPRPPLPASLAQLRHLGMTHVRLPIAADSVIADFAGAATVKARIAALDSALTTLLKLDYSVVVDLHGSPKLFALLQKDPPAGAQRIADAWRGLAPLFKPSRHGRLFAELMNEPPLQGPDWARMQADLLPELRRLLPDTPLVLSTGGPQRVEALTASTPADDSNVLYAVHYYDPFFFTHQGADWIGEPGVAAIHGLPFPIVPDAPALAQIQDEIRREGHDVIAGKLDELKKGYGEKDVEDDMQALADWSGRTGKPVIIDEFGVYGSKALPADRVRWLQTVATAASRHCLGWSHWEYRDGFGFVDPASGRPDPAVVKALLGTR